MTSTASPRTRTSFSHSLIAVMLATAGALALWSAETSLFDVDLTVGTGIDARQVTGTAVALTATIAGVAGAVAARLTTRIAPNRAVQAWVVLAGTVLVLSLTGPLGAATSTAKGGLVALHLLVGVVLILGLLPQRGYGGGRG